ncbi:MAG: DNRLRE domain-containing protein, partial [Gemmatimonadaceae bacterium]|nr:DNRLRE domain-containing protein [Gemmatimonadaceae bacterium]
LRESLAANSAFAMAGYQQGKFVLRYRTSAGLSMTEQAQTINTSTPWVRLKRQGNTFTAYRSADGVTWTSVASHTFTIASTASFGLATSAGGGTTGSTGVVQTQAGYSQLTAVSTTPPAAPSVPSATVRSATQVDLTWTDNSTDESGFRVERKQMGNWVALSPDTATDATSFSDTTAPAGATTEYRVLALGASGVTTPGPGLTVSLPASTSGTNTTVATTTASYGRDGGYATTNYGAQPVLEVKNSSTDYRRTAYLRFDLSSVSSITQGKLRLYGGFNSSGPTANIGVYSMSDTSWDEGTITWQSHPVTGTEPSGTLRASATVTGTGAWYEWDVTSYLQAEKAAGRNLVSLQVWSNSYTTTDPQVQFNSDEAATNKPELTIQSGGGGALTLNTGNANDLVSLSSTASTVGVTIGTTTVNYDIGAVSAVVLNTQDGDDTVITNLPATVPVHFNGGNGSETVTVNGGNLRFTTNERLAALTVAAGAKATMVANGNWALHTGTLSVSSTGHVDLTNNDLIVESGSFSDLWATVLASFGGTTGITSTTDGTQILAMFDNAYGGETTWSGHTVGASAIIAKYTYMGDLNLDGQVTGDDYTVIDSNLDTTPPVGSAWLRGDANLDGIVSADDNTVIDSNLGLGEGNPL